MATEKTQKNVKKYICEPCDYNSSNKTDYMRHIKTVKHKNNTLATTRDNKNYICENCEKSYNDRTGLWRHRKICTIEHDVQPEAQSIIQGTKLTVGSSDIPIELVLEVIKQSKEVQNVLIEQNKELQKQLLDHSNKLLEKDNQLIEQNKQILEIAKKPNMINSNNNNKTSFNLQFFLNETCKDAMNIVDFVNSLQLTNNDFETTSREPTVPWNQIQQWQQEFPDSVKNNTPANEKFTELALAALGGRDMEEIQRYNDKIMKNVLREVILSRSGE